MEHYFTQYRRPGGLLRATQDAQCGRFRLSYSYLERLARAGLPDAEPFGDLFSKFIILQTAADIARRRVEFIALSELFDEIKQGEPIPLYEVFSRVCGQSVLVSAVRREPL